MLDSSPETSRQKKRGESQYTLKLKARQAACQVTGCLTELPNKAYHQRYRICQTHAAMPQMVLEGRHVRFCQHCGRFQALQEFDGAFKSCRKSLQRHRNSQSRRIRTKSSTKASSGSDEMSGGATATRVPRGRQKSTAERNTHPNSSHNDTTEDSNNDDLQSSPYDGSTPGGSGIQTQSADGEGSLAIQCGGGRGSSNGLVPLFGFPEGGVPQEIYTALNGTHNPAAHGVDGVATTTTLPTTINTNNGVGAVNALPVPCTNVVPAATLPTGPSAMDTDVAAAVDLLPIDSGLLYDIMDPGHSLEWIPDLLESGSDGLLDPGPPRLAPLPSNTLQKKAGAAHIMASLLADNHGYGSGARATTYGQPAAMAAAVQAPPSSLDAAMNLVSYEYPNTLGTAHDGSTIMRASLKLFNTTPENLPMTVHQTLMEVVASSQTFLTANARPGCVHITANVVLKQSEAHALETAGARGLLTGALAQGSALIPAECMEGPRSAFLAQLNTQIAALGASGTIASVSIDASSDTLSDIRAIVPLAMTPSEPHHVTLLGRSISGDLDMVVCRRGEDTPNLGVISSGPSQRLQEEDTPAATPSSNEDEASGSGSSTPSAEQASLPRRRRRPLPVTHYPPECFTGRGLAAGEYVQFSLMEVKEGLHSIEIQKGSMLSPGSQSLLVINDAAVVAELRQLEVDATGISDIPAFVQAVGIVVEHLRLRREGARHPNASIQVAQRIAPLAAAIVTTAIARKWPALLRLICPAASPADVQASITALSRTTSTPENLSLLHLVAASGNVELVEALEEWGRAAGHIWLCQSFGRTLITPLHIAAILDDSAAMAQALTKLFGTSCHRSWYYATGADGVTPAQAAKIAGNEAVIDYLRTHVPRSSIVLYEDDSTCSSLRSTGAAVGGGGSGAELLLGLSNRKLSSMSFDDVPPCLDEWPYSTFYGTDGLLRSPAAVGDTTSNSTTAAAAAATTATTTTTTGPESGNENRRNGLNVPEAAATAVGLALSFVAAVGAVAVRFYSGL